MQRSWLVGTVLGKVAAAATYRISPGLAAVAFFGPDLWLLYNLLAPSAQGLGPVYTRFSTERKEVWLTIDDGPDERDTPRILDLLDRFRAKATFFLIGEKAAQAPDLVREIAARGHGIGHHSHSHPHFAFWISSPRKVAAELDDGLAALAGAGVRPRWFRAPVGIKSLFLPAALRERALGYVGWSVRGHDCWQQDPAKISDQVVKRASPGSIILMHEGPAVPNPVRVEAIRRVLHGLQERGFALVIPGAEQLRTPGRSR